MPKSADHLASLIVTLRGVGKSVAHGKRPSIRNKLLEARRQQEPGEAVAAFPAVSMPAWEQKGPGYVKQGEAIHLRKAQSLSTGHGVKRSWCGDVSESSEKEGKSGFCILLSGERCVSQTCSACCGDSFSDSSIYRQRGRRSCLRIDEASELDRGQALAYLKKFGSMTMLNSYIHRRCKSSREG